MATPSWKVAGQYYETCSCDFVCPCILTQLSAKPSKGSCSFAMGFKIDQGKFGDVALDGLGFPQWYRYDDDAGTTAFDYLRALSASVAASEAGPVPEPCTHLDGREMPYSRLNMLTLLNDCATIAYRAASGFTDPAHHEALGELLQAFDELGLATADAQQPRWRRLRLPAARGCVDLVSVQT